MPSTGGSKPESLADRAPFAGGDQAYLRDEQYGDGTKLDVRIELHRRFSTAIPFPEFEAALIDWPDAPQVLECGTGTGRFWDNTQVPDSASLMLTDLSPGMVAESVAHAQGSGRTDVTGRECDVQALPFADSSFDVVVANHMLYHVPDPDLGVAELARVLRPSGVTLISTNGYGHMDVVKEVRAQVFEDHGDRLYEVFGIDTGEARLRCAFASVVWHAYDNDLIVDDPAMLTAYCLSFPPGEQATPAEAAGVADAVEARFGDGPVRVRTRTGAFVCRKPRH
jgi:SAM-dependent methyltransferase